MSKLISLKFMNFHKSTFVRSYFIDGCSKKEVTLLML